MKQEETVTLDDLMSNRSVKVVNPADLLPKREVKVSSLKDEVLGDLGLVMAKENAETRKLAEAMIADMNKAKADGVKPQFRTDVIATEGMQPITFDLSKEAMDHYADRDEITKNAKPSEYLVDLENTTSIKNYSNAPSILDKTGGYIGGAIGPRSIIKDNAEAVGKVIDESQYINNSQANTESSYVQNMQVSQVDSNEDITVDPDDMDDELKDLLGSDYIETFPVASRNNTQPSMENEVIIQDRSNEMENLETTQTDENKPEVSINEVQHIEVEHSEYQESISYKKQEDTVQKLSTPSVEESTDDEDDDIEQFESDEYYDGDEETELMSDERKEQILRVIRSKIMDKIRPVKFDLHSFTVASPVKVLNLFTGDNHSLNVDTADWYLPTTGVNITMRKFEGAEIAALNSSNAKSLRNNNLDTLRLIYDHITNPKKPDFETWIRSVRMEDMDHLYFAIMQASFKDSNYVPYFCSNPKCKDVDVPDKSFDDMIYFYDDKVKADFYEHIERATYNYTVDAVEVERIPISEDYCVDIKMPSLYDILVEPTYLSKAYRTRHNEKITIIGYITNIYRIDYVNNTLIPIDYSLNTDDEVKIIKNKYRLYIQLLDSLPSDTYTYLTSIINKLTADKSICEFLIPGNKCEKCGKEVEPVSKSAIELLFTRHQLAALANI